MLCINRLQYSGSSCHWRIHSHWWEVGYSFEAGGVPDHLVQGADDVGEAGSHVAVLLPAVQH